jgi:hypothetical protein
MKVDGQPLEVDLDKAEQDFAVMMAAPEKSEQDKFNLAPKPEVADTPAPKRTRRKTASDKAVPAPKPVKKAAPKAAPSADVTAQRAAKAAAMMTQLGMMTEMYYTATSNDAFHKDTELLNASAAPFGQVMAEAAAHDKYIAAYLDNEGTGAVGAHVALIFVSGQIVKGVIENHNAETKVQLAVRIVIDKVKKFFGRGRK